MNGMPILPIIPESVICRNRGKQYNGPIEPGMVFAWEPDLPHARELCVVTKIGDALPPLTVAHSTGKATIYRGDGQMIYSRSIQLNGDEVYNEISRFREAVHATNYRPMKV